jgi:hypothetical protein
MEVLIGIRSGKSAILKEDQMIVENMLKETEYSGRINVYWAKYKLDHPDPKWEGKLYKDVWAIVYRIRTTDEIGEYITSIFGDMGYDTPGGLKNHHYLRRI